jgi:tRNA threonylcarbamoyladenosine biosynthesis protein TsaB
MSNILALDTSSDNCSVALWHGGSLSLACELAPRSHTQLVLPMVKRVLSEQSVGMEDLQMIAFGCGPGSFTGIRIGTGVAQGLAYGLACPIYPVSNIKALALQSYLEHKVSKVLVTIDARMDEVYWALCRIELSAEGDYHVELETPETVTAPEQVLLDRVDVSVEGSEQIVGIGSGFDYIQRFPQAVSDSMLSFDSSQRPKADTICLLAKSLLAQGEKGAIEDALPSYVRDTVTWKKLPGRE